MQASSGGNTIACLQTVLSSEHSSDCNIIEVYTESLHYLTTRSIYRVLEQTSCLKIRRDRAESCMGSSDHESKATGQRRISLLDHLNIDPPICIRTE